MAPFPTAVPPNALTKASLPIAVTLEALDSSSSIPELPPRSTDPADATILVPIAMLDRLSCKTLAPRPIAIAFCDSAIAEAPCAIE